MQKTHSEHSKKGYLENYLRTFRKKAGLSQREMGKLLAYLDEGAISRHEQAKTRPPLYGAIAYELIFQKPVSEIFRGLRDKTKLEIEERLLKFEDELKTRNEKGMRAAGINQKLAWLAERRNIADD
jgi:DNA-binding XRE family transcriptional regulator